MILLYGMGRKLTIEEVRNYIKSNNNTLLSDVYINDHTKLNILCSNGHTYLMILNSFKNGRRCPVCKGIQASIRQKIPYEMLIKRALKLGRELITTKEEYEKSSKFFLIRCVCGSEHRTNVDRLRQGCFCKNCANKKTGDRTRNSLEEVKKYIESFSGFILISNKYKNMDTNLSVLCPKGHNFLVTLSAFKGKKSRCPICKGHNNSKLWKTSYTKLHDTLTNNKIKLITSENEYKDITNVKVECMECQHKFTTNVGRVNYGVGCKKCKNKQAGINKRKTHTEAKLIVKKAGYKLITKDYIDMSQVIVVRCKTHGNFNTKLSYIAGGHGCRKCVRTHSKAQQELYDFIKFLHSDTLENDRNIIKPLELDVYIPSLNLAIEYCGIYWHSEKHKDNNGHSKKLKLCNEKGVRLITIFEDEWLDRKDQVKNFLLSVINKNTIKIGARKTEIKEVDKFEAENFLNNNHIQGAANFEIAYGLYYQNELVAIITGNKHHRQGHGKLFVLNRLAFKSNVSVYGGSSKLLKALLNYAKMNGYQELISWSDNRWSEGNVYKKLGFTLDQELPIDYSYVYKQTRLSKQSCQKKILARKGGVGNTEREMAKSLGLYRIFDCGKKRWKIIL